MSSPQELVFGHCSFAYYSSYINYGCALGYNYAKSECCNYAADEFWTIFFWIMFSLVLCVGFVILCMCSMAKANRRNAATVAYINQVNAAQYRANQNPVITVQMQQPAYGAQGYQQVPQYPQQYPGANPYQQPQYNAPGGAMPQYAQP